MKGQVFLESEWFVHFFPILSSTYQHALGFFKDLHGFTSYLFNLAILFISPTSTLAKAITSHLDYFSSVPMM